MQRNWLSTTRVLFLAALAVLVVADTSWAQRSSRRASRRSGGEAPMYSDYSVSPTQYGQYAPYGQYIPAGQIPYVQTAGYTQQPQTVTVTATYQYVTEEVVESSGGRGRRGRRGGSSYVTYQTVPRLVSYSTVPTTATEQTALLPIGDPRRSFYPPDQAIQAAIIDMRLPVANAEVLFDGQRTTQIGLLRQFVTPPLTGERNTYEVRARWLENGRPVEQTRQVRVTAGGRVLVDFITPAN